MPPTVITPHDVPDIHGLPAEIRAVALAHLRNPQASRDSILILADDLDTAADAAELDARERRARALRRLAAVMRDLAPIFAPPAAVPEGRP